MGMKRITSWSFLRDKPACTEARFLLHVDRHQRLSVNRLLLMKLLVVPLLSRKGSSKLSSCQKRQRRNSCATTHLYEIFCVLFLVSFASRRMNVSVTTAV